MNFSRSASLQTRQQAPQPPVTTAAASVNQQRAAQASTVTTSIEKPLDEVLKNVRGVPLAHLTKAERKRLQWEQERGV